jgi:hypothetical protein
MNRLKFLVFAFVAVGLWGYHLTRVVPLVLTGSVEQAQSAVAGSTGAVAVILEARRSLVEAMALKVASTPQAAWNMGPKPGAKPEAPSAERLAAIRSAAAEVGDEFKDRLFVAVSNDVGGVAAIGSADPGALPENLDVMGLLRAGPSGGLRSFEGVSYLVYAVPLAISEKNEVTSAGAIVVGLPMLPDAKALEQPLKALGLMGLAIVSDGKPVLVAGDKGSIDLVLGKLKANASGATVTGTVRALGPLALPLFQEAPVQAMGSRRTLLGTSFEVAAAASARPALEALVDDQVFSLGALLGLVLLAVVVAMLLGAPAEEGPAMSLPPPLTVPVKRDEAASKPALEPEPHAPAPEASPDDFVFPSSAAAVPAPAPSAPPAAGPVMNPFDSPLPPLPSRPPPPVATAEEPALQAPFNQSHQEDDEESQRTVAYPAFKPPVPSAPGPAIDPFSLAGGSGGPGMADDSPDATRVAAVPAELIKAARGGTVSGEVPSYKPSTPMPKVASAQSEEDKHFQEVFRDFVATRERCHEPPDGITFEKFKTKLVKNKEQLLTKYQGCRSVRFQVYVKDGKAALKATPLKD